MAQKFHNTVNGPRPCKAEIKDCPLGGEHFTNYSDAQKAYDEDMKKTFGKFSTLIRPSANERVRRAVYKTNERASLAIKKAKASPAAVAAVKKINEAKARAIAIKKKITDAGNTALVAGYVYVDDTRKNVRKSVASAVDTVKVATYIAEDRFNKLVNSSKSLVEATPAFLASKTRRYANIARLAGRRVVSRANKSVTNTVLDYKSKVERARFNREAPKSLLSKASNLRVGDKVADSVIRDIKQHERDTNKVRIVFTSNDRTAAAVVIKSEPVRVSRRSSRPKSPLYRANKALRNTEMARRLKAASSHQKAAFAALRGNKPLPIKGEIDENLNRYFDQVKKIRGRHRATPNKYQRATINALN